MGSLARSDCLTPGPPPWPMAGCQKPAVNFKWRFKEPTFEGIFSPTAGAAGVLHRQLSFVLEIECAAEVECSPAAPTPDGSAATASGPAGPAVLVTAKSFEPSVPAATDLGAVQQLGVAAGGPVQTGLDGVEDAGAAFQDTEPDAAASAGPIAGNCPSVGKRIIEVSSLPSSQASADSAGPADAPWIPTSPCPLYHDFPVDQDGKVNLVTFLDDVAELMGRILVDSSPTVDVATVRLLMSKVGSCSSGSGIDILVERAIISWMSYYFREPLQTESVFVVEPEAWKREYLLRNIVDDSTCVCDTVTGNDSAAMVCCSPSCEKLTLGEACVQLAQHKTIDLMSGSFSSHNPTAGKNKDDAALKKDTSVKTLRGMIAYIQRFEPKLVILEHNEYLGCTVNPDSNLSQIMQVGFADYGGQGKPGDKLIFPCAPWSLKRRVRGIVAVRSGICFYLKIKKNKKSKHPKNQKIRK